MTQKVSPHFAQTTSTPFDNASKAASDSYFQPYSPFIKISSNLDLNDETKRKLKQSLFQELNPKPKNKFFSKEKSILFQLSKEKSKGQRALFTNHKTSRENFAKTPGSSNSILNLAQTQP